MLNNFFFKLCRLLYNREKYRGAEQGADDNITRRMPIAFWIPKATNTQSEYEILAFSSATRVERKRLSIGYTYLLVLVL